MELGVVFPQTELSADPSAIRDFVQAIESVGYDSVFVADHVLGADSRVHKHPLLARYSYQSVVHEPLTTMAYMAAITTRLTLATGVIILPQRQTALVAKQAAEVDVLSQGRVRLGIGVGWNTVEYEALGQDFASRGARYDEQIQVLRALWTQEVVDFHGQWHDITHAGINPLPVQRPIPIWLGVGSTMGHRPSDRVLRRVGQLADGWCPHMNADAQGEETIARIHAFAREAGRDPATLSLEGRIWLRDKTPEAWGEEIKTWQRMGATHLVAESRQAGLTFPDQHLAVLRQFKDVADHILAG